jgi:L-fuculose-phosphate aldolase
MRIAARTRTALSVVAAAREMHDRGLVVGTVGNVSARVEDRIQITPSRCEYRRTRPWQLAVTTLDGSVIRARRAPSRELPLHVAIYERRPDVAAVVHTHSPAAVAWSMLAEPLPPLTEEAEYYGFGHVATTPYAPSGSAALASGGAAGLAAGRAVLLERHGVVAVGSGPREALWTAAAVEHVARVALTVRFHRPSALAGHPSAEGATRRPPGRRLQRTARNPSSPEH